MLINWFAWVTQQIPCWSCAFLQRRSALILIIIIIQGCDELFSFSHLRVVLVIASLFAAFCTPLAFRFDASCNNSSFELFQKMIFWRFWIIAHCRFIVTVTFILMPSSNYFSFCESLLLTSTWHGPVNMRSTCHNTSEVSFSIALLAHFNFHY